MFAHQSSEIKWQLQLQLQHQQQTAIATSVAAGNSKIYMRFFTAFQWVQHQRCVFCSSFINHLF